MSDRMLTTDMMREWHVRADHTGNKSRQQYEAEFDRWLDTVRDEGFNEAFDKGWATAAFQVRRILGRRSGDHGEANQIAINALRRVFKEES